MYGLLQIGSSGKNNIIKMIEESQILVEFVQTCVLDAQMATNMFQIGCGKVWVKVCWKIHADNLLNALA